MDVIKIQTDRHGVLDITNMVKESVSKGPVEEGICCVFVPHTTAGLVVYSGVDPKGLMDLNDTMKTLVPSRTDFHHQCDPPTDAAGHIKSALAGISISFIIHEHAMMLGDSQYIYFYEFDGPRSREVMIQCTGTQGGHDTAYGNAGKQDTGTQCHS